MRKYGEQHHRSKYPNKLVECVLQDFDSGVRIKELSKKYKVPYNTICGWCYAKYRGRLG